MKIIKQLAEDIKCNIHEAEDKIETAYALKEKYPNAAAWYREMAAAHLNFNNKGHELITAEIANYRSNQVYTDHPEYAEGMLVVWKDMHVELITESSKVKSMIDSYK